MDTDIKCQHCGEMKQLSKVDVVIGGDVVSHINHLNELITHFKEMNNE